MGFLVPLWDKLTWCRVKRTHAFTAGCDSHQYTSRGTACVDTAFTHKHTQHLSQRITHIQHQVIFNPLNPLLFHSLYLQAFSSHYMSQPGLQYTVIVRIKTNCTQILNFGLYVPSFQHTGYTLCGYECIEDKVSVLQVYTVRAHFEHFRS